MYLRRLLPTLVLIALALNACRREPALPPEVIARVNDRMITLSDFKRYLERNSGTDMSQLTPEVSSAMLDQFMEEVVLSEYAASHKIEVPAEKIAQAVRTEAGATVVEKRDDMRRERLVASITSEIPEPDAAAIQSYYRNHQSEFRSSDEVRIRQILVGNEQLAGDLVQKLRQGASFGELALEHSRAPNARHGGEVGFVGRGELPKMFEEELFKLQPGQVSEIIRTDSGFHIFLVEERRAAGTLDLTAATPMIRLRLREEAVRDRLAQIIAGSRKEMTIAVLTRRLPFEYSGSLPKAGDE